MPRIAVLLSLCFSAPAVQADAPAFWLHKFQRWQLSDQFLCEGATAADLNRDGHQDIIAGPYWYAGPEYTERSEYYPAKSFSIDEYSDNFFAFAHDFNGDQWPDLLIVGFPGKAAYWYENPRGELGHWQRHLAFDGVDNESPTFTDLTGDDQPELVFHTGGRLGYAEIPESDPAAPWTFRPISPDLGYGKFNHGLGVGDLNGDGRPDLLEKKGWWQQPALANEPWSFHQVSFSAAGGAQMLVHDLDGDGDQDVVTSKAAHGYGLAWFENVTRDGRHQFREHRIMGEQPSENDYGIAFSQLHAVALADIDRDGLVDIVTGKRFWAHQGHDPGGHDPPVSYWFQTIRTDTGVRFVPHIIDNNSGVGTQLVVADVNNDSWPDLVVGNKKGTFALLHQATQVDQPTWQAAQPKPQQSGLLEVEQQPTPGTVGIVAKTAAGRPLNLDFERGGTRDWTAVGTAFAEQPIWGDKVHARRRDSISGHIGNRWIGTYEVAGDAPQGTMTSTSFPITHPYAVFYVGGGSSRLTRVELVRRAGEREEVLFAASGQDAEQMRPVAVDLRQHLGQEVFLRIVDESSVGWGHINFDHFRFYDRAPQLSALEAKVLKADEYPHAGLSAAQASEEMVLPAGFHVTPFASEPDIKQPIAMALDDRGRVWVAEAYAYPRRAEPGDERDRILIFEDTDGDGRFDARKVFAEGLNLVSGLEIGFGGVWVGAAPYLLYIPDRDHDDVPDGEPQILLDGWGYQDTHETLNSFLWGPDGWLYGCHGVFTHSLVGKPHAEPHQRTPLNAGIWRYHPVRHEFEVFAEGTSNPWGVDFDDHGQAVATACVIPHLFHMIQGGRYHRQGGQHFNPNTYDDIKTIADHRHYLGDTPHSGNEKSDSAGGGHAHAGAMIYLGGHWPERYRNRIFMNNIHGQRLNTDILLPRGSGFVGSHGPDFLLTRDRASQMLNFRYGPDGQVYVIDWYDMQACHENTMSVHDRGNGRIYKIIYDKGRSDEVLDADAARQTIDVATNTDRELAEYMLDPNDWYVRHARRVLQQRAAVRSIDALARDRLVEIATTHPAATRRLRALWALHVTGSIDKALRDQCLADADPYVRAWSIQLALERHPSRHASSHENRRVEPGIDGQAAAQNVDADAVAQTINAHAVDQNINAEFLDRLAQLAADDPSAVVRLYICSALQRLPAAARWPILTALARHAEDADDHNLPLMIWYAAEPLVELDQARALEFALACGETLPLLRSYMLRRIGSLGTPVALAALVRALGVAPDLEPQQLLAQRRAIIAALRQSMAGRRKVTPPESWGQVYAKMLKSGNEQLAAEATAVGVQFGDPIAMTKLRQLVAAGDVDLSQRRESLKALLAAKDPQLVPTLLDLLADPGLRATALSGLALYDAPEIPGALLDIYRRLPLRERQQTVATLASRSSYARQLLQAVAQHRLAKTDLSADVVRQLHNLQDERVDQMLTQLWGKVRITPADKMKQIEHYRQLLAGPLRQDADIHLGRAIFAKTCQQCHKLYGVGDTVGPDLTGSHRQNTDYLLSNIVDPSALISKEYQNSIVVTEGGRVLTGLITDEDENSITLRSATETVVLPKAEIDQRRLSDTSMMPDNQLQQYSPQQIVSLLAYLQGSSQNPMLATADNSASLFNGRDLTGWRGEPGLWSVEQGAIVGRSEGAEQNSFLISDLTAEDFQLSLEVRLTKNAGNSGIQFRSRVLDGFHELFGYQADIGPDWWGKLYEENGRGLLWDQSGEPHLLPDAWNKYTIRADGDRIQTWLNGQPCVDLDDAAGARRGVFALQIHSGGPTEVKFRNIELEILAPQPSN